MRKEISKVASKFKFPKVFGFYLNLLEAMYKGQELPYHYIYSCGGRNSGKTYCMSLFISYLFYYQIPAKVVIFRKKNEGVIDTEKEILNRLQAANIPYEGHKPITLSLEEGKRLTLGISIIPGLIGRFKS